MPELQDADIATLSLVRVREEMKTATDRIEGIKGERNLGDLEGAEATEASNVFRSMNRLGERFDELKALDGGEEKQAKLTDWLNAPAGTMASPDWADVKKKAVLHKSAGTIIAELDAYKAGKKQFEVEVPIAALFGKAFAEKVLGEDNALAGVSDEFGPQSIRLPGVTGDVLFQGNNIAPTFLQGTTNQFSITYMNETVTSQGATETAEGATKPGADISFAEATSPVANIAVTLQVTNQLLEDEAFMRAYVNGRLRLFVQNREDSQLLNGDGAGANLTGILAAAGTNADSYSIAAAAADATVVFDTVYRSIRAVQEAFLNPMTVGMAAATWERFVLGKDGNNQYLLGRPGEVTPARLWGRQVVVNEGMPAEAAAAEPIAVWAPEAAMVVRRNAITLAVSDSHASTFASNVLTFRAEERVGFPIFRAAGITVITSAA